MIGEFISTFKKSYLPQILHFILILAPIWVPVFLVSLWFDFWITYKRREWMKEQGSVLLEIKLPKETLRGPAGMELVLNGIFEPAFGTFMDAILRGKMRDWFSLELVSIGGQVKFFIWSTKRWKKIIETRIYAQYPNVEVYEVPDYTQGVQYDAKTMSMFAVHTALTKADVYPIRTYIDYGLDKKGDEEEEKIDPLTPLLEYLGSIGPGEQCWIQILIQAHKAEKALTDLKLFPKEDWSKQVKKEIQKIFKEETLTEPAEGKKPNMMDLSKIQQETVAAIQRSQDKLAYDTMIRMIHIAKKEDYTPTAGIGLIGSMRQFGSKNLNGIKPIFFPADHPWQDFMDIRKTRYRKMVLDAYKRRSAFNGPYRHWMAKPYVLNTEELATLFHFPGSVASTPTLTRIPSKKAQAPANLPI